MRALYNVPKRQLEKLQESSFDCFWENSTKESSANAKKLNKKVEYLAENNRQETFTQRDIISSGKEGENFNRRNTLSISMIKNSAWIVEKLLEHFSFFNV